MKVAAIGLTTLELDIACKVTLSKFVQEGNEVHIIIARDFSNVDWKESEARSFFDKAGLANIHFMDKRDYSIITQENASALNSVIRAIKPNMVIMPFWKSLNLKRKILARTALIACRGIGNVLMYELDKNPSFVPTVNFSIRDNNLSRRAISEIEEVDDRGLTLSKLALTKTTITITDMQPSIGASGAGSNNKGDSDTAIEAFESHRLSLVEDGWL